VDADLGGDAGQAHGTDAVPPGSFASGAEDGVPALQLLLGAAGSLEGFGGRHGSQST
jgi:hypothetical protein